MNDKLYRDIGKRIKLARRACSITQERLAEMVGVTNQHISNIEVGNKAPSYELLYAIVHNLCTPFTVCHFLQAGRRLWKAPLVSQLFPFLWAEPHHADVSLFCEGRSWQSDFSNGRSRITAWVARFLLERSWRTVPVACYLTNVSVCFIQLSKNNRLVRL